MYKEKKHFFATNIRIERSYILAINYVQFSSLFNVNIYSKTGFNHLCNYNITIFKFHQRPQRRIHFYNVYTNFIQKIQIILYTYQLQIVVKFVFDAKYK